MSTRTRYLLSHPRRTLAALVMILASVGVAVGSGAAFTAQTSNPSNTFASGALTMSNSKNNAAILTAANMLPGNSVQGNVDIHNTSTVPATMTLARTALSDSDGASPLSAKLTVVVKDCGDFSAGTPVCTGGSPVKYTGTLAAMTANVALGTFTADEKHRYEFTVTFDAAAGNVYQNATSSATFQWNGAQ